MKRSAKSYEDWWLGDAKRQKFILHEWHGWEGTSIRMTIDDLYKVRWFTWRLLRVILYNTIAVPLPTDVRMGPDPFAQLRFAKAIPSRIQEA